jgi:beta-glucosidase
MIKVKVRPQTFPKKFVWGFAAAAPQIEGAAFTDGKGESVWDYFCRQPGKVANGDTLDVACDHYHRYDQDFRLMAQLGAKHYRLSLAWPRIYPEGDGALNQKGLDFYHRLFDSMEKHGLQPWVTMFHWDLPQALETRYGGWRDRRVAEAFARYADTIVKEFGDRVKNWITLNEIPCFTHLGYRVGSKAPGLKLGDDVVNQTFHHALLCHGEGVRAVREHGGRGARVGLTDNSCISVPLTETEADIAAARECFQVSNAQTIDAMYRGHYHPTFLRNVGKNAPKVARGDFDLISLPTDFLGLNIYTGGFVRAPHRGAKIPRGQKFEWLPLPAAYPQADASWLKIMPQVLYWGPRLAAEVYGAKSIYITENGCGYNDPAPVNGEVHDLHRRDLVRNYLGEMRRGIGDGVPVHGYFLWSFMDNYEWEDGYERRFGVVYCDFKTQKRTPKTSARWFSRVITENRLV